MKTTISYDWTIEVGDQYGDIIEVEHWSTYAKAKIQADRPAADGCTITIGLVRDVWQDDGNLLDRQWAYLYQGKLPETFDMGAIVPKRFAREVK